MKERKPPELRIGSFEDLRALIGVSFDEMGFPSLTFIRTSELEPQVYEIKENSVFLCTENAHGEQNATNLYVPFVIGRKERKVIREENSEAREQFDQKVASWRETGGY